jgi:hypothetical protein
LPEGEKFSSGKFYLDQWYIPPVGAAEEWTALDNGDVRKAPKEVPDMKVEYNCLDACLRQYKIVA